MCYNEFVLSRGFEHSSLIVRHIVSTFVPFLPLEQRHVKSCIKKELRRKGFSITKDKIDKVNKEMYYLDIKLYSKSRCKRVSE